MKLCIILIVLLVANKICAESIDVRVVNRNSNTNLNIQSFDFGPINSRLIETRPNRIPSKFIGPKFLEPLLDRCFLYDNDPKYYFRICPLSNVTQHEKATYSYNFVATSFHAILGIWHEWKIVDYNRFDSLIHLNGDECGEGIDRKAYIRIGCPQDWTINDLAVVVSVVETDKCLYEIELHSPLFCELGSVYSYMDEQGKQEWDSLETLYKNNYITEDGYKSSLQMLFNKYGLKLGERNTSNSSQSDKHSETEDEQSCKNRLKKLEMENLDLKIQLMMKNNL